MLTVVLNCCGTAKTLSISVVILKIVFVCVNSSGDNAVFKMPFETTAEDCSRKLFSGLFSSSAVGHEERWKTKRVSLNCRYT